MRNYYICKVKKFIDTYAMYRQIIAFIAVVTLAAAPLICRADSVDAAPLHWRIGLEGTAAGVPGTNAYLRGDNPSEQKISSYFGTALRGDFSFGSSTRYGRLYPDVYQGIGLEWGTFCKKDLLGTPWSLYVYQGARPLQLGQRLSLGYEWQFGAAMGWKHYQKDIDESNIAVSTSVTARMGIGLKLHYEISDRLTLAAAINATHYSNGNTSWPNKGVNTIGGSIGLAYSLGTPRHTDDTSAPAADDEDSSPRWIYDISAYCTWRKRVVIINDEPVLCPGKFGVIGLQLSPMRRFNRWFAAGASLDLQYDESGGLAPYHAEETWGDELKFYRPPFDKQLSIGLSARAELIMPIFTINVGIGYDLMSPKGNERFYQTINLKTFVTKMLYINTGYRLGEFR